MLQAKIGQFAVDDEFATSTNAASFVNATFGWLGGFGADLPEGGPAYPLSTPGVRLKAAPDERFTVMAAVFNGTSDRSI